MTILSEDYVNRVYTHLMSLILALYYRLTQYPPSDLDQEKWNLLSSLRDWPLIASLATLGNTTDRFETIIKVVRTGAFTKEELNMTGDEMNNFLL